MDPIYVAYRDARAALLQKGDEYLADSPAADQRRAELLDLVRALPPAEACSDREREFALRAISASRLESFYGLTMPTGQSLGRFARDALDAAERRQTGSRREDAMGMKEAIQDLLL